MARWIIDPDHSVAAFIVRHMMVANVRGQFNRISGEIHFDPDDVAKSSVQIAIDASGIYTGIQKRDDHLRSADFFEIEIYPQILFKSSKAEDLGGNRFKVTGDLSIHGITNSITLEGTFSGTEKSPFGEISMGFTAETTINREDYRIMWNMLLESGGFMVGKEVVISLDVEADLQTA
jgi:polyisoprenoid-binding protein YceI